MVVIGEDGVRQLLSFSRVRLVGLNIVQSCGLFAMEMISRLGRNCSKKEVFRDCS